MIMHPRHVFAACVPVLAGALWAAGALSARAAPTEPQDAQDSNALIMTAEIALRRDDCGRAATDYTVAAQRLSDVQLAKRAAEVALGCGQYETASRAAARWHQLLPADPAPLHASVQAHWDFTGSMRPAVLSRAGCRAPSRRRRPPLPARGQPAQGRQPRAIGNDIVHQVQQLAEESGVPATLAMMRGVQTQSLQSGAGQLALADLAFDGWNYREALQYAQRALSGGAERASAQLVLARAHAGLGEVDAAVAAASAARTAAPKEQSFADADVLIMLGREDEARETLETLTRIRR